MSQILIDRQLLQRLLDAYFENQIAARAYLGLQQHTAVRQKDQTALLRFLEALEAEKAQEQDQIQGIRERLQQTLASEDDAAFLVALAALLPH